MAVQSTEINGRLSTTQKSLTGNVVGFIWSAEHVFAAHGMAIIEQSTFCTSDLSI